MADLVPLGKITIAAAGTTQLLTVNTGPQAARGIPTKTVRQLIFTADAANAGQVFLLPAGKTAAANPGSIIAVVPKGAGVAIPQGVMLAGSIALDSYCLDTDTAAQVVYACGVVG